MTRSTPAIITMRRASFAAAAIAYLLALPTVAAAAETTTLGSRLGSLPDSAECEHADGCLVVQQRLPGGVPIAVPRDGVIVRWRVKGSGKFAIAPATYQGVDTIVRQKRTGLKTADSTARATTFPTRFPVKKGQYIALFVADDARIATRYPLDGAAADAWKPAPPVDRPTLANNRRDSEVEVGYNADLEPDADRDGYGDVSQDKCPSDPATQGACPPLPPPAQPAPSPPPPAPDTLAPSFGPQPSLAPRRPRVRRRTELRFGLSEVAHVTVTLHRRSRRGALKRVRVIERDLAAGSARIPIRGLRRGRYRLTVKAVDASGNRGRVVRLPFRVRSAR